MIAMLDTRVNVVITETPTTAQQENRIKIKITTHRKL